MSTAFEEALNASLRGLDVGFRSAFSDLQNEVDAAGITVLKVTRRKAQLVLKQFSETPSGTYYDLLLMKENEAFGYQVAGFLLTPHGYPIKVGRSAESLIGGEQEAVLQNDAELRNFFVRMASNPDSSLVLRLALILRQAGITSNGA